MSFLISGLAIFFLKCDSLLAYCESNEIVTGNIKKVFGTLSISSDTHFRTVVDKIETNSLKGLFKEYFFLLKNKNVLNDYEVFNKSLVVLFDGTGCFHSNKIHCDQCLQKRHKNGVISYEHQAIPAVVVHPNMKEVIPIGVEFIEKQDGETKNDCERNASKRLITQLKKDYPDQKFIVVEDGLSSNVPHVLALQDAKMDFILGTKPGNHKKFFEEIFRLEDKKLMIHINKFENTKNEEITRKFRYKNCVNLNRGEGDAVYVNYFEVVETVFNKRTCHEKTTTFSWITSITISPDNIFKLMEIARARWMIENETFNTLKNQDYNFEHNYGHGKKNLTNNMGVFMFIAFLIDQIQQRCCKMFQKILLSTKRKIKLWEYLRACFLINASESLYEIYEKIILFSKPRVKIKLNTVNSS